MTIAIIIIVVVALIAWPIYGYMKGAPYGLGAEGIKYSMVGLAGMKKLNKLIEEEKQRAAGAENPG